jgi:hypothetical protein
MQKLHKNVQKKSRHCGKALLEFWASDIGLSVQGTSFLCLRSQDFASVVRFRLGWGALRGTSPPIDLITQKGRSEYIMLKRGRKDL